MTNKIIIGVIIILVLGVGAYFLFGQSDQEIDLVGGDEVGVPSDSQSNGQNNGSSTVDQYKEETVIGQSVEGRDIIAYHYGTGDDEILLVGGIHGGYEWNTALIAYEAIDYFKANPSIIPNNVKVTVIPVLNPDGLYRVTLKSGRFTKADVSSSEMIQVSGRFNANKVDLNRNFDCDWQAEAKWQDKNVSGGTAAFSEPESKALRDYVNTNLPTAILVWYSAAGGVFASNCHGGVLAETNTLTNLYSQASGYPAHQEFNFYEITGDAVNWMAKRGIPAISVLLTDHQNTEWSKNQQGIEAILNYYASDGS